MSLTFYLLNISFYKCADIFSVLVYLLIFTGIYFRHTTANSNRDINRCRKRHQRQCSPFLARLSSCHYGALATPESGRDPSDRRRRSFKRKWTSLYIQNGPECSRHHQAVLRCSTRSK